MLNVGVIMGRLTADPEIRVTQTATKVTSFTVAVERDYAQNGERQTDFIDVVAWRHTAEFICQYFRKGSMIAIKGSYQTRTYEDSGGRKQKRTELIADTVNFCGSKGTGAPGNNEIQEPLEYTDIPEGDLPF